MAIILGLDLGVTSIGWCLFDNENQHFIATGSRIFQAGVKNPLTNKESPLNATRREKRQIRRQIFRKAQRQELLLEVLQELGWLPKDETLLALSMAKDPYELRAKALDEALTLEELGRIFYQLSKRRGFKSSRKSGDDEDKEGGVLFKGDAKAQKVGINELQEEMEQGGFRTVGEYLASLNPHDKRRRNRYILRQQYLHEFDLIWQAQLRFHPEIEKPTTYEYLIRKFCKARQQEKWEQKNLYDFLKDYVVYFQRALKSQKQNVGMCTFEPTSRRAPKSSLVFQEFRIWDKLNSIRLVGPDRNFDPLTAEEKLKAYEKLSVSKEQTIEQLLKLWKISDGYSTNYDNKDKVKGNVTAHALIAVFGDKVWKALSQEEKEKRWKLIYDAEDNEFLVNYGKEKWGLDNEKAEKLKKVSFEKMYAELSQKAMRKLLPLMKEQNLDYTKACETAGYNHSQPTDGKNQAVADQLSPFTKKINSPIVAQGLHELRKVVNTLIQEYAIKPDIVRIELARELKMPKEKRERINLDNKIREDEHREIRNELIGNFAPFNTEAEISADDLVKYKLWLESGKVCPYTGQQISTTALFTDAFQIEHILPYSRSMDDSFQNKTLCERSFNKDRKGNLMPYEMLKQGRISESDYTAILERAKGFQRGGKRNVGKFKRFTLHSMPMDMVAQQLNDTQFLSVAAKEYLREICPNIETSVGAATGKLRKLWGLNSVLNPVANIKSRDDHRHHALDAIVVACTNIGMIQKLSVFNQKNIRLTNERFPFPWSRFRLDVKEALEGVLISHKSKGRVRGQLHDETLSGKVLTPEKTHKHKENDPSQLVYTTRIDIKSLDSYDKIKNIGDETVRNVILKRLQEKGVKDISKKFEIPKGAFDEPLWMPNKKGLQIPIKRVRIHDVSSNKIEIRKDTFVNGDNNHHMIIFQKANGRRDGKIVSLFDAVQRKKDGLPVINTDCGKGNEFIMTLSKNEMVLIDKGTFKTSSINWQSPNYTELSEYLYKIQKITKGKISFTHHLSSKSDDFFTRSPNKIKFIKVKINEIGEISPL